MRVRGGEPSTEPPPSDTNASKLLRLGSFEARPPVAETPRLSRNQARTPGFSNKAAVEHAVTHVGQDAPLELLLREALKAAASRART